MGKTTAQKGAHVVKDGIRHNDVYATAVGDATKAYFFKFSKLRCSIQQNHLLGHGGPTQCTDFTCLLVTGFDRV